jgi:hypothetical protein
MISKIEIKVVIESALDSLQEARWRLQEAKGMIGDKGNRMDVEDLQEHLSLIISKTEDLIYDKSDDDYETEESYEFVTDDKVTMLRKSNSL